MIPLQKSPSKKIIYLAIGALLVVIGIFIYKNHSSASILKEKTLSYEASSGAEDQTDTDNDGLSDWQETNVWHTNPSSPDSDEDGTTDGDEVNQHRDPAKTGPDDSLLPGDSRITTAIKAAISNDNSANDNLTQNLSKTVLSAYMSVQDQSGTINDQDKANLIQQTLSNVASPSTAVEKYTASSLSIIDSASKEDIKTYGNNFSIAVKNDYTTYLNINEPTYDQTAQFYQNLSKDLAKIKVPSTISALHLQIVNGYNQMYVALTDLNNYENDPLKGALSVEIYQNNQTIIPTFYQKLADYFKNNDIIFTKDDPGFFWKSF